MKHVIAEIRALERKLAGNLKSEKWLNHEFEDSSRKTDEYKQFARDFLSDIKKLAEGYELVDKSVGHFYVSGFLKKDGKFIYFSCSDIRHFPNEWYNHLLIRTAKDEKDYTGGSNGYTKLPDLKSNLDKLMGKQASVPDKHQLKILIDTIKNPSKALLGGPSVEEAKEILKSKFKYTDHKIKELEGSKVAGHIVESDKFNQKYPKVLALVDAQDELRQQGQDIMLKIVEGIGKLEKINRIKKPMKKLPSFLPITVLHKFELI